MLTSRHRTLLPATAIVASPLNATAQVPSLWHTGSVRRFGADVALNQDNRGSPNGEPLWLDFPPMRPSHFVRCPHRLDPLALLLPREPPLSQPGKRCLDEPRFQQYPGARSIAVELRAHAQALKSRVHAAGRNPHEYDP